MRKVLPPLALLAIIAAAGWFFLGRNPTHPGGDRSLKAGEALKNNKVPDESVPQAEGHPVKPEKPGEQAPGFADVPSNDGLGRPIPVKASENPQAASVAEALRTKKNPERLSMLVPPKPYDKAAFEANPDAYLSIIEPGRVMQGKQPARDVPALKADGGHQFEIKPNAKVVLAVRGEKRAPVTFVSADMGTFEETKLNCVTVRANEEGVAKATFVATPGADGDVNILVGSPEASGQVRFVVMVEGTPLRRPPEGPGKE